MTDDTAEPGSIAVSGAERRLSRAEVQGLSDVPPELEWFANLDNPRTRRAYRLDVQEFTAFAGVERPEEMRQVTRAHRNRLARKTSNAGAWPRAPSGASWPPLPRFSTTSAR
jgi:hypothetical protein